MVDKQRKALYVMYFPLESRVEVTDDWEHAKQRLAGRANKVKKFYDSQTAKAWLKTVAGREITNVYPV